MLTTATGILTNEVNVGFNVPAGQSKYLTAGNDVVDLSNWTGTGSVNIGDAFSNDNDKVTVMANDLAAGADLKLTSIENLEIINAKETKALNLVGENFKGLESIELKGDATTLNVSGFTYGVKIDATENADNIFGGTKADTINGGAGNDTIQGNQGNDVLTGGNGADTFIVGNAKDFGVDQILDFSAEDKISMDGFSVKELKKFDASTFSTVTFVVGSIKAAGVDQILDFSAEDKIALKGFVPNELKKFDASTFSTVTYKTLDSVLATFAAGGANVTKAGDVVIFSYDGKTYALLSTGAGFKEANDALVDITGANVASLTESNFGAFISQYNYTSVADFNKDAEDKLIPVNTAIIEVGSGDEALKNTDIQYIKDGGISGATVSIELQMQNGSGETFDATLNDFVAKFASKVPALNITGGTGNDVIVVPSFGGTINGGSGNDTIDASAAIGAVTINGGDGADSIIGGSGNDKIDLTETSATSDTVVFAATAAANGVDTITGFTAGSSGDKLNISAFTTKAGQLKNADASSAFLEVGSNNSIGVLFNDDDGKITASDVVTSSASNGQIQVGSGEKAVVLVTSAASASAGGLYNIYYITGGATATVELVGNVTTTAAALTLDDNFA